LDFYAANSRIYQPQSFNFDILFVVVEEYAKKKKEKNSIISIYLFTVAGVWRVSQNFTVGTVCHAVTRINLIAYGATVPGAPCMRGYMWTIRRPITK
jgi:hypothetical protein